MSCIISCTNNGHCKNGNHTINCTCENLFSWQDGVYSYQTVLRVIVNSSLVVQFVVKWKEDSVFREMFRNSVEFFCTLVDHAGAVVPIGFDEQCSLIGIRWRLEELIVKRPEVRSLCQWLLIHAVDIGQVETVEMLFKVVENLNPNLNVDEDENTLIHLASDRGHSEILRYLIDCGGKVNATDVRNYMPIHLAAEKDRVQALKTLMHHDALTEPTNNENFTALHYASLNGSLDCVQLLLSNQLTNQEYGIRTKGWFTPLHIACLQGHLDVIDYLVQVHLLDTTAINALDALERTPLHIACEKGYGRVVEKLLEADAELNMLNSKNESPLCNACQAQSFHCAEILIRAGCQVNIIKELSMKNVTMPDTVCQPIHIATSTVNLKIIKILLENGASVNERVAFNFVSHFEENFHDISIDRKMHRKVYLTPIHFALAEGNIETVKLLIEKGADIYHNITDNCPPPIFFALEHSEILKVLLTQHLGGNSDEILPRLMYLAALNGYGKVIKLINAKGVSINHTYEHNRTALHIAAIENQSEAVLELLDLNYQTNLTDEYGYTALHYAAEKGHLEIVKLLVEAESTEINLTTKVEHRTPLMLASAGLHADIVEYLIKNGADSLITDNGHWNALHWCLGGNYVTSNIRDETLSPKQYPLSDFDIKRQTNVAIMLVKHNREILYATESDDVPLHMAILNHEMRRKCILEEICKLKASLTLAFDTQTIDIKPLTITTLNVVTFFLENGANPNRNGHDNTKPIHLALTYRDLEMVELLIEKGSSIITFDGTFKSTLHYAAETEDLELMKFLLKEMTCVQLDVIKRSWLKEPLPTYHPINILKDNDPESPLFKLKGGKSSVEEVAKTFINLPDVLGWTALHIAASRGDTEMVQLLVDKGASLDFVDTLGCNAYLIAHKGGFVECAEKLKKTRPERSIISHKEVIIMQRREMKDTVENTNAYEAMLQMQKLLKEKLCQWIFRMPIEMKLKSWANYCLKLASVVKYKSWNQHWKVYAFLFFHKMLKRSLKRPGGLAKVDMPSGEEFTHDINPSKSKDDAIETKDYADKNLVEACKEQTHLCSGDHGSMTVCVTTSSGKKYSVQICWDGTVANLKTSLVKQLAIRETRQFLYCFGYYLDDDDALIRPILNVATKVANLNDALTVVLPTVAVKKALSEMDMDTDREAFAIVSQPFGVVLARRRKVTAVSLKAKRFALVYSKGRSQPSGSRSYLADCFDVSTYQMGEAVKIKVQEDDKLNKSLLLIVDGKELILTPYAKEEHDEEGKTNLISSMENFHSFLRHVSEKMSEIAGTNTPNHQHTSSEANTEVLSHINGVKDKDRPGGTLMSKGGEKLFSEAHTTEINLGMCQWELKYHALEKVHRELEEKFIVLENMRHVVEDLQRQNKEMEQYICYSENADLSMTKVVVREEIEHDNGSTSIRTLDSGLQLQTPNENFTEEHSEASSKTTSTTVTKKARVVTHTRCDSIESICHTESTLFDYRKGKTITSRTASISNWKSPEGLTNKVAIQPDCKKRVNYMKRGRRTKGRTPETSTKQEMPRQTPSERRQMKLARQRQCQYGSEQAQVTGTTKQARIPPVPLRRSGNKVFLPDISREVKVVSTVTPQM